MNDSASAAGATGYEPDRARKVSRRSGAEFGGLLVVVIIGY
jgi:hypothetical protein